MTLRYEVDLPAPPIEREDPRSGLTLCWTGTDVAVEVPLVAGETPGAMLVASRGVAMLQASTPIAEFLNDWQFHANCPAHSGAVPAMTTPVRDGEVRRWRITGDHRPGQWTHPNAGEAWGLTPCLYWTPPMKTNDLAGSWAVRLVCRGNPSVTVGPLATLAWNDTGRIAETVESLQDLDYWLAVASLKDPSQLAAARARFERDSATQRRREERLAEQHMLYRDFLAPEADLHVDVRKVARALRQGWAEHMPAYASIYRFGVLTHIDLALNRQRVRAAETLNFAACATDQARRHAILAAFRAMLGPVGYDVIVTMQGRIVIGRDRDFLSRNLRALIDLEGERVLDLAR